ncbi:NAD-dependent protein deacylase [Pseudomonas sp. NPDC007930]|uniref:SIR2 family NAD-dependent protein deacylase n=1 Tax=Pseudomonas sp. NPDC007930 TaxID=3364417 RepID=UPI0036E90174
MTNEQAFAQAVSSLGNAHNVVVFTGAGVSAESGIATFRDQAGGRWNAFDPARLATPAAFRRDPARVWGWYEWRRACAAQARPNAAHVAIAALQQHVRKLLVVTQNVDALHECAGSEAVVHLHGTLQGARCFACARPHALGEPPLPEATPACLEPPRCSHCGGRVRPGVVWFGEQLPKRELRTALNAAQQCDLIMVVGTSGVVYPAAQLPEVALKHGARVIQVNTEPADNADSPTLVGRAGEWLPKLLSATFGAGPTR